MANLRHAYQASRFFETAPDLVEKVHQARSAHEAFVLAHEHTDRQQPNWNELKAAVMLDICRHKLQQNPYVERKLRQTNNERLVEDSPVDSFWGWGADKEGRNELGKVWMTLRKELFAHGI